jgi:hypothetical protein
MLMKGSKVSSNVKLLVDAELLVSEDYARDVPVGCVSQPSKSVTHSGSLTNNASPQQEGPTTNHFWYVHRQMMCRSQKHSLTFLYQLSRL